MTARFRVAPSTVLAALMILGIGSCDPCDPCDKKAPAASSEVDAGSPLGTLALD
jgi:hypothetical protein